MEIHHRWKQPHGQRRFSKTPLQRTNHSSISSLIQIMITHFQNKLPLLQQRLPKMGRVGYFHAQQAALGGFAIPISQTIDYALNGLKTGSTSDNHMQLAPDHSHPFKNLTATTSPNNPWKHIQTIAPHLIEATFPSPTTQ
jgi:hypothetical protein